MQTEYLFTAWPRQLCGQDCGEDPGVGAVGRKAGLPWEELGRTFPRKWKRRKAEWEVKGDCFVCLFLVYFSKRDLNLLLSWWEDSSRTDRGLPCGAWPCVGGRAERRGGLQSMRGPSIIQPRVRAVAPPLRLRACTH